MAVWFAWFGSWLPWMGEWLVWGLHLAGSVAGIAALWVARVRPERG